MKSIDWIIAILYFAVFSTYGYRQLVNPKITNATQSSTYGDNIASRAIDGSHSNLTIAGGSCSHTGGGKTEAWLQIDLKKKYNLKAIKFWYRNDRTNDYVNTMRLNSYNMQYRTDNGSSNWKTCYKDMTPKNTAIPMPSIVECHHVAQHIRFYTKTPSPWDGKEVFLEICELEVYGCQLNEFGENCTSCGDRCGKCDIVNGCVQCQAGFTGKTCDECRLGYTGDSCDPCTPGWYGFNCTLKCSGNCYNDEDCNNVNGSCLSGCKKGYRGDNCSQTCEEGTYGLLCQNQCSGNCFDNDTCDNVGGNCTNGCAKGWEGSQCFQACTNDTFGKDCQFSCSKHCFSNTTCDRFDGTCPFGCEAGWLGSGCIEKCLPGNYGFQCNETCATCYNMLCSHIDGTCDQGCADGWTGPMCENVCPQGLFGQNCSMRCGNCENETCHHVNGSCQGNCKAKYKGERCQDLVSELNSADHSESPTNIYAATGAGIGLLLAILLFISFVVIRIRRRRFSSTAGKIKSDGREDHAQINAYSSIDSLATDDQQPANADEAIYNNIADTANKKARNSRVIVIADLSTLISAKRTNECSGFKEEYQSIPYGEEPHIPCTIGKLPENTNKNRYKTTFPYDHSRIVLRNERNDYINANYIQSMKNERVYIASQGPRLNTLIDHWNMIWQEKVSVIVMLTNLVEGIKKKCEKYWPDLHKEMVSGKIKIQLLQEKQYSYYVVRILNVTNTESRSIRTVTQFHYTQWPDHGVPEPVSLAIFQKHVRRIQEKHEDSPLLVHCSAGVGRTGTFIALDALHQHGQETGSVNVQEYVKMMRKDRMNMVQNCEQYIELYKALFESFNGKSDVNSKDTFLYAVRELNNSENSTPQWLQSQYEELQTIKKIYSPDDKKEGNRHKELNMTRNILPVDRYRAFLTSPVKGRTNYYNAVLLSTFADRDMLIAAQYPLSGNSVDLFRLLLDYQSSIVVFVNPLSDIASSSEWFTESSTTLYPFEITKKDASVVTQTIRKHCFEVRHTTNDSVLAILFFELMCWKMNDSLPSNVETISDLLRYVLMEEVVQSSKTPITVLSKDGATGCGVFCSVYNAHQQLQQDDEVDMFTIVRQLQIRRPEMISTLEEYRFCYQALLDILTASSSQMYSNSECVYANT